MVAGCSGGGGTFTTTVAGDKPLGTLSGSEVARLCDDANKFLAASTSNTDACRIGALSLTNFVAMLSPTMTDTELQMTCSDSYSRCVNQTTSGGTAPDAGSSTAGMCSAPPANCTATVAELVACVNDSAAQYHKLATSGPDCAKIARASFSGSNGGAASIPTAAPASCQTYQSKCSGISDAAKAFTDEYCALIDPCCTAESLRSQCATYVTNEVMAGTYDDAGGTACLDALRLRQSSSDFCGGFAAGTGFTNQWAVVRECDSVFGTHGSIPPGDACTQDSDCASGPNGGAICTFTANAQAQFTQVCAQTTAKVSDGPCLGTIIANFGTEGVNSPPSPAQGVFCEQKNGVFCDDTTHLCVPVHGIGGACTDILHCDNVTTYCNFNTNKCEARLPLRATCAGHLLSECDGTAYCNSTTMACTPAGGTGATCSTTFTNPPDCLAGQCNNGTCPNPLTPVCF